MGVNVLQDKLVYFDGPREGDQEWRSVLAAALTGVGALPFDASQYSPLDTQKISEMRRDGGWDAVGDLVRPQLQFMLHMAARSDGVIIYRGDGTADMGFAEIVGWESGKNRPVAYVGDMNDPKSMTNECWAYPGAMAPTIQDGLDFLKDVFLDRLARGIR